MATNIPLPGLMGESFLKGMDSGSSMFHNLMNAKYNNSLHPSGDVANALYVEQIKAQYGENDPRYLQAKAAHDSAMAGHQSLMDYRRQLSNLAPYRATSPLGKTIAESEGQGALDRYGGSNTGGGSQGSGGMDGGDSDNTYRPPLAGGDGETENPHRPPSQEEIDRMERLAQKQAAYEAAIGKQTTDTAIRTKIPYAKNVETTLNSIVPDDLLRYSGLGGGKAHIKEFLKAAMGNPSDEWINYNTSKTSASMLTKQLRQFYGDSIQPAAVDRIDKLTDPSYWLKDPKTARAQFDQLKKITNQETSQFTEAGTSPIKVRSLSYNPKTKSFFTNNNNNSAQAEGKIDYKTMSDEELNRLAGGQ